MKPRLYKDTHRLGFNTRDNPQDVPLESGRMLVNCLPGHPSCFPRDGIPTFNSVALPGTPAHILPWVDSADPKVILHIGQNLYWKRVGSGSHTQFGGSNPIALGAALSYYRIKNMLFVNTNVTGASHQAFIIEWSGSTFTLRNSNLVCPDLTVSISLIPGTNFTAGKWRSYAFTLVNRNDSLSVDGGGQPKLCTLAAGEFHPGLLESIEDMDERVTVQNTTGGAQSPRLSISRGAATVDTQASHARIYVTEEGDSEEEVKGFSHRWLADFPIRGSNAFAHPWVYTDPSTVGQLAGDLDLLKTTGYEPLPPGSFMLHHQGRTWVGGIGTGEEIGRQFYSEAPQDVEFPQKWFSLFKTGEYFKDTSYEDSEQFVGIGLAGNDVYWFGRRSVWYLRDGDVLFEPTLLHKNMGTSFVNSITSINKEILYLSNVGPAAISERQVQVLESHTAGEVWPKIHDNSAGYFYAAAYVKSDVRGFYFRENWFLCDGTKLIGFYMPAKGQVGGPWSIELGDAAIDTGLPCVLDPESVCVMTSRAAATPRLWDFLKPGTTQDNGQDFWLKGSAKAYYVDGKNRDKCGELLLLKAFVTYEDSSPIYFTLKSDSARFVLELVYDETTGPLTPPEQAATFRNTLVQPIPEGFFGSFFEVEWRKLYRTPYRFTHKGWLLEWKQIEAMTGEFVSSPAADGLVEEFADTLLYLTFDENSATAVDSSLYARHHAYSAGSGGSRTHQLSMVPGGGQSLVAGGAGSGYSDDWSGLDHIGVSAGLNDASLTFEHVFDVVSLSTLCQVQEGGNGTTFWRYQVNTDGSVEFILKTSTLSYSFVTAAGAILAGTEYFLQFVLSDSGRVGQFYGGPRTGNFTVYPTTRRAF